MKTVELETLEQVKKSYIQNGINYEPEDAFDTGFQNEFDNEDNPEDYCVLEMSEEEARKYVVEETVWRIEKRENGLYLCGDNDISGFGYAEERIDNTEYVQKLLLIEQ